MKFDLLIIDIFSSQRGWISAVFPGPRQDDISPPGVHGRPETSK